MNQNVFGVVLFSLIVGTAIFVSEFFVTLPTPPAVTIYETPTYTKKTTCRKVVNQITPTNTAFIKVRQAVLNQYTSKLNTDFSIKRDNPQTEGVRISLHFFVKDGRLTRYLATESITVKPDFDHNGVADYQVLSSFQWLDDLKRRDNLYVVAESSLNYDKNTNLEPAFNAANATPVLLMKD